METSPVPLSGSGSVRTVYFGAVVFLAAVEVAMIRKAIAHAAMVITRLKILRAIIEIRSACRSPVLITSRTVTWIAGPGAVQSSTPSELEPRRELHLTGWARRCRLQEQRRPDRA